MICFTCSLNFNEFSLKLGCRKMLYITKIRHAKWNASFCLYSKRLGVLRWLEIPPKFFQDAPKTASWPPKKDPRCPQDGPKTPPRRPRCLQDGAECAQLLKRRTVGFLFNFYIRRYNFYINSRFGGPAPQYSPPAAQGSKV